MKDLTKGNIIKNFFIFALPLVFSGLFSQLYGTVDTIIAGKFIGSASLASIGATAPFLTFVHSFFWGFDAGFGICMAQNFGAKNYKKIKETIITMFSSYFVFATVIGLIFFVLRVPLLNLLKVDPKIMKETVKYFSVILLGLGFIQMQNLFLQTLNAFGESNFPFVMSLVSSALNVSGNIFSVVVLKIGVLGIALSSVFSAMVVDVLYFLKLRSCLYKMGVGDYKAKYNFAIIGQTKSFWLPTSFQQGVMYISTLLLSPMLNGLGADASASYTVSYRIYNIVTCVFFGASKSISTYVAQAIGGKKLDTIKKGFRVGILQCICFLIPILTVCIAAPNLVCGFFFESGYSGKGIEYSINFLKFFMPFVIFNLINNAFHAFYRGTKEMNHLVACTFFGSFMQLAVGFFLTKYFGMYGFYAGWAISWIADAALGFALYLTKGWRRRVGIIS